MDTLRELFYLIFGQVTLVIVIFNFILLALGQSGSIVWHVRKGLKSPGSPNKFDKSYFYENNKTRIYLGIIIFLLVWANVEWFVKVFVSNILPEGLARWSPFFVGLLIDRIYVWIGGLFSKKTD